jgi:hypothetical protein
VEREYDRDKEERERPSKCEVKEALGERTSERGWDDVAIMLRESARRVGRSKLVKRRSPITQI